MVHELPHRLHWPGIAGMDLPMIGDAHLFGVSENMDMHPVFRRGEGWLQVQDILHARASDRHESGYGTMRKGYGLQGVLAYVLAPALRVKHLVDVMGKPLRGEGMVVRVVASVRTLGHPDDLVAVIEQCCARDARHQGGRIGKPCVQMPL